MSPAKDFGFYSGWKGKLSVGFEQESYMVWLVFSKFILALVKESIEEVEFGKSGGRKAFANVSLTMTVTGIF